MKKLIVFTLSLCLVLALGSAVAFADERYADVTEAYSWAEPAIERWSEYRIVEGDGINFAPERSLMRSEAAAIFSRLFGYTEEADISAFKDVDESLWYGSVIKKAVAAGVMLGDGENLMPTGLVTREQFFVMFARALGLKEETELAKTVVDFDKTSSWAQGFMTALVNHGFVKGTEVREDGSIVLSPADDINRASTMSLLDNTIVDYVVEDGATVEAKSGEKIIVIVADNVKITGSEDATVVVAKEGATVDFSGYKGTAYVSVVAKDETLKNVPAGSTVSTIEKATGTKVNGKEFDNDTTKEIEESKTVVERYIPVHTHSYQDSYTNTNGVLQKTRSCPCGDVEKTYEKKFEFEVSDGRKAVKMGVFEDYSFLAVVPNAEVNAASVTAKVSMRDVASLDVTDELSHSITVSTGLSNTAYLGRWISNAWNFSTNPVAVTFTYDSNACTFNVSGSGEITDQAAQTGTDAVIIGEVVAGDASALWNAFISNTVTVEHGFEEDSKVSIDKDSYIMTKDNKLVFSQDENDLVLDNFSNLSALKTTVADHVQLVAGGFSEEKTEGFLKSGSFLQVGSSKASLKRDVKVTVEGLDISNEFTSLQGAMSGTGADFVKAFVEALNDALDGVQTKGNISVSISAN